MIPNLDAKLQNLELIREDVRAGSTLLRGMPPVVSLYTSEVCNLRCVMCVRSQVPGVRKLDRELLKRTLDEVFPLALKSFLTASNGEPMLGDFDVIRDAAIRHGVALDMATNGTHLTVERYRAMRACLQRLNVSLDAHVPELYERIRVGSRFATVLANVQDVAEEHRKNPDGVAFDLSAILMRSNAAILPDFVRFAGEIGVDHVHIQALRHFARPLPEEDMTGAPEARVRTDRGGGRALLDAPGPFPDELEHSLDAIADAAWKHGVNVDFGDHMRPPVRVREVPMRLDGLEPPADTCWSVSLNFGIQLDGSVYPCCHPTDYRLGSLLESSVAEIWNGAAVRRLRAAHYARRRIRFCTGCVEAPYLGPGPTGRLQAWVERLRLGAQHLTSSNGRRS